MCFSATGSFTAAAMLTYIGFLTNAQIQKKSYWMVASIPLLFALQQMAEGAVWLTMGHPNYDILQMFAVYLYLFFAFCIWPSWIPISLWMCEGNISKKKILRILSILGLIISLYTAYLLINYPVNVQVFNCSIWYSLDIAGLLHRELGLVIYAIAAVGSFFISSLPLASFLGSFMLLSLILTYILMYKTFISVWCFFAALISLFTYLSLRLKFPKGTTTATKEN